MTRGGTERVYALPAVTRASKRLFLFRASLGLALLSGLLVPRCVRGAEPAGERGRGDPDGAPREDDWELGLGGEVEAKSRFIWRGAALSRGPVMQPSAWAAALGLTAALWCNMMLTSESRRQPSAVVASVKREFAWRTLRIEPGFSVYEAPGNRVMARSAEASIDAGVGFGDFELQTSQALDVGTHPRAYFGTAGVAYEPEVQRFTFTISADVGWATAELTRQYFHRGVNGLDIAEAALAARYDLTDLHYVALHAEGSTLVTPLLRQRGVTPTLTSAGVTFGFEL